jgi:serine/threonine-protein kinase
VLALLATPPLPDKVTPPRDPEPLGLDWDAVLADLGYGRFGLAAAEPERPPPVFADERRSFEGTWPDAPDLPLRVEAAAAGGTLVWLDVTLDGTRPSASMVAYWTIVATRSLDKSRLVMFLLLPALAAVFAWRNHRLRRVDLRGAGVAFAIVLVTEIVYGLCRDPFYNSPREWNTILDAFKTGVIMAVVAWLFYLALEPHVRRTWPTVLIGWSRFAARQYRDPLVGKEVLVGSALGLVGACSRAATPLLGQVLGLPGTLSSRLLTTFPGDGGLRDTLGNASLGLASGFVWALMILFVATVARLALGRAWPLVTWALFSVLVVTIETGMGRGGLVAFVEGGVRGAIALFALSRFGLLACTAAIASYTMLTTVQPTLQPDLWFFGPRVVLLPVLAAVGAWAFVTALGGRRLLPDVAGR